MRPALATRARLALLAMAAVAPALAIADVALLLSLSSAANSEVDHDLVAQATLLQSGIDDANGHLSFGAAGGGAGPVTAEAAIVASGTVVAAVGTDPLPPAVATGVAARAVSARGAVYADASSAAGVPQRVYATPVGSGDQGTAGTIVVSRSVAALAAAQRQTLLIAVLLSSLTLALTGLIARWLAGRVLRPVRTIAGLARTISEKDLHRRIEVTVPADELGDLVETFNAMLSRLQTEFHGLHRFTADASHELRAPLAIMRGELELSLGRQRTVNEYRQSQRRLLGEVNHLSRIADRLLLLARADAGTLVAERAAVDVSDMVTETAERWRAAAARKRVSIVAEACAGSLSADAVLLRQVLDNLVDNAIRHSPPGGVVSLRAVASGGGVELDVADEGPGVPPELRERLFDRFFRASVARTPGGASAGAGLGLAVASSIARAHGGELTYRETGAGALFRLRLPASASD